MVEAPFGRKGHFDIVLYKTENDYLKKVLKGLGGTFAASGVDGEYPVSEPKVVPLECASKKARVLYQRKFPLSP